MTRRSTLASFLTAVFALFFAEQAAAVCTHVSKDGVCDRYQGVAYCRTGPISCPDGYSHMSSSSTPNPCVPEGVRAHGPSTAARTL
jgi:hypothetical protein